MPKQNRTDVIVFILVILFGVSAWVDICGLWIQLPIMVQELPEGWNLPSYLVVVVQLANIGPLLYSLICANRVSERPIIFVIIATGGIASLLLIFFWKQTTFVAGDYHSTALFILSFALAFADCTSTVVFFPFMVNLNPSYISAYFGGEGLGGLLPGLLGLVQGAGRISCNNVTQTQNVTVHGNTTEEVSWSFQPEYGENVFSFEVFFSVIVAVIVVSEIAFALLIFHPRCKKEHIKMPSVSEGEAIDAQGDSQALKQLVDVDKSDVDVAKQDDGALLDGKTNGHGFTDEQNDLVKKESCVDPKAAKPGMTRQQYITTLLLTGLVNGFRNSILLAIQSFSTLPYGVVEYHLAVVLWNVSVPIACTLNFFWNMTSLPALYGVTLLTAPLSAYIIVTAALSPAPFLAGTIAGSILIVLVWTVNSFLLTYIKVCLATLFREEGKKAMFHCGIATQAGSAISGILMFVVVNLLQVFKSANLCS